MEDKYILITQVINSLNAVKVSGENDMSLQLGSITALKKLIGMLKEEDGYHKGEIDALTTQLKEGNYAAAEVSE